MAGHEDKGGVVLATSIVMISILVITLALRLWSTSTSGRKFWILTEFFAISTFLLGVAICSVSIYWVSIGFGQHMHQVQANGTRPSTIYIVRFAEEWLYNAGISTAKLSALFIYSTRLQPVGYFRHGLGITVGLVFAWWVAACALATASCSPVRKQWDFGVPGTCLDFETAYGAVTVPNILLDLIVLVLPLPVLASFELNPRKIFRVVAIFAPGFSVMFVTIARLAIVATTNALSSSDFTWTFVTPQILLMLEIPFAFLAVSLPDIFHLLDETPQLPRAVLFYIRKDSQPRETIKELNLGDGFCGQGASNNVEAFAMTPRSWNESVTASEMERVHVRTDVAVRLSYADRVVSMCSQRTPPGNSVFRPLSAFN